MKIVRNEQLTESYEIAKIVCRRARVSDYSKYTGLFYSLVGYFGHGKRLSKPSLSTSVSS